MGKNSARDQIPAPVLTAPRGPDGTTRSWDSLSDAEKNAIRGREAVRTAAQVQSWNVRGDFIPDDAELKTMGGQIVNAMPPAPALGDLAARALATGAAMAREYAAAAGELCRMADTVPTARASARRLLKLALAHLEV